LNKIDCVDTYDIICPFCGIKVHNGCDSDMGCDEVAEGYCDVCEKDFKIYCEVTRTFSTTKTEE